MDDLQMTSPVAWTPAAPGTPVAKGPIPRWSAAAAQSLLLIPCGVLIAWHAPAAAAAYHAASRLAYLGGVGAILVRQGSRRRAAPAEARRAEADFRRFRATASALMSNDALSFVALVVVTAESFAPPVPLAAVWTLAVVFIVVGVGVKVWATRTLGNGSYYWRDFFIPSRSGPPAASGPYRLLSNPMYSVGYAHAYGAALGLLSWPGLVAALLDQAGILVFNALIERPHVRAMYGSRTR